MKQGFDLYWRAVAQLFSNIGAAVWSTGPAWVALSVITSLCAYLIVGEVADPAQGGDVAKGFVLPPYFWTYFMISQCLSFMTLGYIGPKFHRALLPENTSDLPFPYASYLFEMMKLGLIGIGLAFLGSRVVSVLSNTLPGPLIELTLPVLLMLGILYVLLRFAITLPAVSMGRQKSLHEAWAATQPFQSFLAVSLVLLVVTMSGLHSLALLLTGQPWLSVILGTVASWFALMVLLSFLNVIYRESRRHRVQQAKVA